MNFFPELSFQFPSVSPKPVSMLCSENISCKYLQNNKLVGWGRNLFAAHQDKSKTIMLSQQIISKKPAIL